MLNVFADQKEIYSKYVKMPISPRHPYAGDNVFIAYLIEEKYGIKITEEKKEDFG